MSALATPLGDLGLEAYDKGYGVLPLPHGAKFPPPPGLTGAAGRDLSRDEVAAVVAARPDDNIGLRLPRDVIGLDVDDHDGKSGAATIAALEANLGALPLTYYLTARGSTSTSRTLLYRVSDSTSRTLLHRVSERRRWGAAGADVDTIQHDHRYTVGPGSIHPNGARYECYGPDGDVAELPDVDDLPHLTPAWCEHLARGATVAAHPAANGDAVAAFTAEHGQRRWPQAARGLAGIFHRQREKGARHDALVATLAQAAREVAAGYYTTADADAVLRPAWDAAMADAERWRDTEREYADAWAWAIAQVAEEEVAELRERLARYEEGPARLFSKEGLLAQTAAEEVLQSVQVARLERNAHADDASVLWHHDGGVWRPGAASRIERETARLLGERVRRSHIDAVTLAIRTGELPELSDRPPHPDLLNFTNTMLRWRSGETTPHDPTHHSTIQLAVPWDPEATCPTYDAWLADVLPADAYDHADEVLGYLMMSGNPLHRAIMLRGPGRNGKGSWLRMISALLGAHNCSNVTLQSLADDRFAAADLYMKLANVAGDLSSTRIEDSSRFKEVTGGDVIRAERKYGQPWSFHAWAVPIFAANITPGSDDTTVGYLSRWEVLPFETAIAGREDPTIEERIIAEELPGLAVRGVRGLRRLMERGRFARPPSVQAAADAFAADVDQVRAWIAENVVIDADEWTERSRLLDDYRAWARVNGRSELNAANFYKRLEAAGVRGRKRHGTRGYAGIRLAGVEERAERAARWAGDWTQAAPLRTTEEAWPW
jgi:P4 family phage/plasmid primase-like protien